MGVLLFCSSLFLGAAVVGAAVVGTAVLVRLLSFCLALVFLTLSPVVLMDCFSNFVFSL